MAQRSRVIASTHPTTYFFSKHFCVLSWSSSWFLELYRGFGDSVALGPSLLRPWHILFEDDPSELEHVSVSSSLS